MTSQQQVLNPKRLDGLRNDGKATQPVCAFSQGGEVIHEDLVRHFSLSQLYHCVRRAEHRPTLTNTQRTKKTQNTRCAHYKSATAESTSDV